MAESVRLYDAVRGREQVLPANELCVDVPVGMDVLNGVARELPAPRRRATVTLEFPETGGETCRAMAAPFPLGQKPDGEFLVRSGDVDEEGRRVWHVAHLVHFLGEPGTVRVQRP